MWQIVWNSGMRRSACWKSRAGRAIILADATTPLTTRLASSRLRRRGSRRQREESMLEIEVKYRAQDATSFDDRLRALGATPTADRQDADAYYNAPHRDFAVTDEALRVRRIGEQNYVTYKGPRKDPT